jgi:trehalose 2-sulfotransferase
MTGFERSYVVCTTPRSGSTLLCELLKSTGVAGAPEEYFEARAATGVPPHPGDYLAGLPRTGAGIRDDQTPPEAPSYSDLRGTDDYREHLRRTFAQGTTANGVFGAKLMFRQLIELEELTGVVPDYRGLRGAALIDALLHDPLYVWMRRRDKVRQAISLWRALQTRAWRSEAQRSPGERPVLYYSFDGIDHLVQALAADDRGWERFFVNAGIEPLTVLYEEDVEPDRTGTVLRVLERLGIDPPAGWEAPEPIARQADSLNDDWAAAYRSRATAQPA